MPIISNNHNQRNCQDIIFTKLLILDTKAYYHWGTAVSNFKTFWFPVPMSCLIKEEEIQSLMVFKGSFGQGWALGALRNFKPAIASFRCWWQTPLPPVPLKAWPDALDACITDHLVEAGCWGLCIWTDGLIGCDNLKCLSLDLWTSRTGEHHRMALT